jgi:hypothetical protein
MNTNTRETLIGLQCFGLDLETGTSPDIDVKELEDLTNIRQVSNGSKIIRKDCPIFSKFNFHMNYGDNGEIVSYTFNGYKNSNDLLTEHTKNILRLKDKITSLQDTVEDLEFYILNIISQPHFIFTKEGLNL